MRWGWLVVGALLVAACGRFGSEGGDDPGTASRTDGGPSSTDGAAHPPLAEAGADADAAAGLNLLPSGSFEATGVSDCGGDGWLAYQCTATLVTPGKFGQQACKFCGNRGETGFTIDGPNVEKAIPNAKFFAHAWLKRASPGAMHAGIVLRAWNGKDAPVKSEDDDFSLVRDDEEWAELSASLTVPADVRADFKIDAYVVVNGYDDPQNPPCAITDEIEIERVE